MAKTLIVKPLGLVLQTAGLVNSQQVQIALSDRQHFPRLKIGEIMARRGWISQQTADFFAVQWPQLSISFPKQPIGQYFKAAGLIDESQIKMILQEQASNGLKFGALAVIKGIISQTTLDFFLEQLNLAHTIRDADDRHDPKLTEAPSDRVKNHLIYNQNCEPSLLLNLYRQIRQQQEIIATGSPVEKELVQSGLVIKDDRKIKLDPAGDRYNFDESWIQQQLVRLQPYSKIRVRLFGLETIASDPYRVLVEVNNWTGGQPFLTQKIYQILRERDFFIPKNQETTIISELVHQHIIDDWETKLAAPHLLKIRSQLLNPPTAVDSYLHSYQKIWHGKLLPFEQTPQQQYLIDIGLIKLEHNKVRIANRIYHDIFDRDWLKKQKQVIVARASYSPPRNNCNSFPKPKSSNVKQQNSSRLITLVTLLICFGGLTWFGLGLIGKYQQTRQLQEANRLLRQKKYTAAITAYDRLLPENIEKPHLIWINRGYAFLGLERYQKMLQTCNTATLIEPEAALGWNCQGEALYYLEQYPEALESFEQAIAKNPQEATFWLNKARVLSALQQHQEAITASQQAIQLTESAKNNSNQQDNLAIAFNQQGQNLLHVKEYQRSLFAFEKSLLNSPNYLSAQQGQGIALYELGKYRQAIAIFEKILQRDDLTKEQKAISWLYTGVSLCQTEQFTSAEQAFKQVLSLTTDPQSQKLAQKGCGIQ